MGRSANHAMVTIRFTKFFVLLALEFVAACRETGEVDRLDTSDSQISDDVVSIDPEMLPTLFTLSIPGDPQGVSSSRAEHIAAQNKPGCIVAVGVPSERRIHMFDFSGVFLRTIDDGNRWPSSLGSMETIAFSPKGELIVGDGDAPALVLLSGPLWDSPTIVGLEETPGRRASFSLWISGDGAIFEFGMSEPSEFLIATAPVRAWGDDGTFVGSFGSMTPMPGGPFTSAFNYAGLAGIDDTLLMIQHAFGRILSFPTPRSAQRPSAILQLPLLFTPPPALSEQPVTGSERPKLSSVRFSPHTSKLSVDPSGNRFVVQNLRPRSGAAAAAEERRNILVSVARRTNTIHYYDLGGQIVGIAATQGCIYAIIESVGANDSSTRSRRLVAAFPNPLATDEYASSQGRWQGCET